MAPDIILSDIKMLKLPNSRSDLSGEERESISIRSALVPLLDQDQGHVLNALVQIQHYMKKLDTFSERVYRIGGQSWSKSAKNTSGNWSLWSQYKAILAKKEKEVKAILAERKRRSVRRGRLGIDFLRNLNAQKRKLEPKKTGYGLSSLQKATKYIFDLCCSILAAFCEEERCTNGLERIGDWWKAGNEMTRISSKCAWEMAEKLKTERRGTPPPLLIPVIYKSSLLG